MTTFAHPLPFGAEPSSAGTRFRIWAPSCERLRLRIGDGEPRPLRRDDGGWHEGRFDCEAGARYRYVLDDGSELADPTSRAQDGGAFGASVVVDPRAYVWRHPHWRGRPWPESVLYELHVGAFGGFDGVRAQLPRLAALGVTTLQLMPVAQCPGARNWGYDGVLPYAPAASYGAPDALKALVDDAHGHGLSVMLDVVYNHLGPDGNVLPRLAAPFFRADVATPWGPAIDFRRHEVREFFLHNALYWLQEYRFDGLRLDAVHAIAPRDWLPELAARVRAAVEPDRRVHLVVENEHNDAALLRQTVAGPGFDAQWNDDAHHVLHVLLTGERDAYYADYADDPTAGLARWLGEGFVYQGQPAGVRDGAPRGQPSADLPPSAFVNCLQNHDQVGNRAFGERLTTLAKPEAVRAATAVLLLTPQVPMLFMGEEWGSRTPFLYFTDHRGELADAVRDGRRREFAHFPAFADPVRRAAIPDPNAAETFERSIPNDAADADPTGAHARFVRGLLQLRRETLAPRLAGARSDGVESLAAACVLARWRLGDGARLTLFANLSSADSARAAQLPDKALYETHGGAIEAARRGRPLPWSVAATLEEA